MPSRVARRLFGSLAFVSTIALSACEGGSSDGGPPPVAPPNPTPTYSATPLGTLGGLSTRASGINASGQVVGASAITGYDAPHAFLYSGGAMSDLGTLGGLSSAAWAINDHGHVTGSADAGTTGHAFLYSDGAMTVLGTLPGGTYSEGHRINEKGQIAGTGDSYAGAAIGARAILYTAGALHDLGVLPGYVLSYGTGINASGQVTGYSLGGSLIIVYRSSRAFLYSDGVMADLGAFVERASANSYGNAINAFGQVTGIADDGTGAYTHAFLYSGGTMMDLGALPGGSTSVGAAINNNGQVVGYPESAAETTAFLYSGGAMHDLNTLVTSGLNGAILTGATGINDNGQIAADSCQGYMSGVPAGPCCTGRFQYHPEPRTTTSAAHASGG